MTNDVVSVSPRGVSGSTAASSVAASCFWTDPVCVVVLCSSVLIVCIVRVAVCSSAVVTAAAAAAVCVRFASLPRRRFLLFLLLLGFTPLDGIAPFAKTLHAGGGCVCDATCCCAAATAARIRLREAEQSRAEHTRDTVNKVRTEEEASTEAQVRCNSKQRTDTANALLAVLKRIFSLRLFCLDGIKKNGVACRTTTGSHNRLLLSAPDSVERPLKRSFSTGPATGRDGTIKAQVSWRWSIAYCQTCSVIDSV